MKKFRDARLDALGETYDVAFEFKPGAPPTLTAFGEDEDDVKTVDVGSWTADVIEEYVRSTLTPRATSPPRRRMKNPPKTPRRRRALKNLHRADP